MIVLSTNLKRLRLAKKMTQEQAAERLGVSTQTVSRWECGTTLPDVTMLPSISRLYGISIDDLYRENAVGYENHAQRLASIYRTTWEPDDFSRAEMEFRKLHRNGQATPEDLRQYGILHQYMLGYCIKKADELFDLAMADGNGEVYWRTKRQKLYFRALIGKGLDSIQKQLSKIQAGSNDVQEWICLIAAYEYAQEYDQAYQCFCHAIERFPENAMLYVYGGDICREQGNIDTAFRYWDKALVLDPTLCDAKHSKAFCFESLGSYAQAYTLWCEIAADQEKQGFDIEAARSRIRAEKCREKTNNPV